jgi:hypothetical protein
MGDEKMDAESFGLAGGAISGVAALAVGIAVAYCAIRAAKGSQERSMAIRLSIILWIIILPLGIAALILPDEYRLFAFYPLWLALPFYIKFWNERQQRAKEEDAQDSSGIVD